MFHEGTLQSGISRAIQEQKLVACFVQDDGDESAIWEAEWLQSGWLSSLLEQKAVLLRLEAGSTEAGFLSAFCPVSNIPTVIVIQNGQLKDQLVSGVEKNEFINRIRKTLGADPIPGTTQPSAITPQQTSTPAQVQSPPPPNPTPPPPDPAPAPAQEEHHPVSPILPPSSKAKGKQKVTPPDPKPDTTSSASAAQKAAREALRKKKQEEKDELERIRARIEADKVERKAQAAAQKAERELERQAASSTPSSTGPANATSNKRSQAKQVNLNVRLFDGRTIRSTFPRDAKLQDDIRPWVDREIAAEDPNARHPPYFFKQILAPLPSRELSAGDESETLGDIDLAPSATLVLVPVKGYTEAYAGGNAGVVGGVVGGVTGLVGGAFGLAYNAVGYVGSTLGSVVGYGAGSASSNAGSEQEGQGRTLSETRAEPESSATIRVRTLADQRAGETRSQEFYNGNSLDFEPNEDDSNKDESKRR